MAILGPIIAAPLANPNNPTHWSPSVRRSETTLGCESVVRMARDASSNRDASAEACASASARPASSRSIGSWWPMTPVEATRTCSG